MNETSQNLGRGSGRSLNNTPPLKVLVQRKGSVAGPGAEWLRSASLDLGRLAAGASRSWKGTSHVRKMQEYVEDSLAVACMANFAGSGTALLQSVAANDLV